MLESETREPQNNLFAYLFFLSGQWISILGSNIVRFGIIWFLAATTGSPLILALAAVFGFAPFIIVTPFAGVFIDRWNRKKVIIFVDFVQAFMTFILIIAFSGIYVQGFLNISFTDIELVAIILGMSIINGIFGAFHTSAVDTLLPIMVPKNYLSRVNGINYLVNGGIQIIGPLIGAFVLKFIILRDLLWLDSITFLIAVIPTLLISIPMIPKEKNSNHEKETFRTEFVEGTSFIRETKGLFPLLMVFTGANFFLGPLFTQIPIIVSDLHLGVEEDLALVMAMQQSGMLIGSLIMSTWKGFENNAKGVATGLFIGYIGMYLMVLAPIGNFYVLGLGLFVTGFTLPIANVSSETIWAKTVPRNLLGRVYAVRRTIAQFSSPVGMLLAGMLAEFFGLIPILTIFTTGGIFLLLYTWVFTSLSRVEKVLAESQNNKDKNKTDSTSEIMS
ncbi:MAG: MFS transporter [Candidatus Hodarchaeales archaeon]|jgi:DHA3 family macrolide efflux protein-like MFS transporter